VAHWPIQTRAAKPGRPLSAMLTPQCCALVIAPARKDRVDNGLGRPGSGGDCILHSRWYLGEYLAAKPIGFEFAKLCCQRVLGDARDRAPSAHRSAKRPPRKPNRQQPTSATQSAISGSGQAHSINFSHPTHDPRPILFERPPPHEQT
jgi:hypothetical protein